MARPTLFTHRKFLRLAAILKMPKPHVLGHLEYLWQSGYQAASEHIGDSIDLELAAEWTGEQGSLTKALLETGMIDQNDDGSYSIHDFWTHAPRYVQQRAETEEKLKRAGTSLSEVRSRAGRKGAEAKWQTDGKPMANEQQFASDLPSYDGKPMAKITPPLPSLSSPSLPLRDELPNGNSPSGKPKVARKPPPSKFDEPEYSDNFLAVWNQCPKKARIRSSRKEAWEVWVGLRLEDRKDDLLKALDVMVTSYEWSKDMGNAIPGVHRWLRRKNWEEVLS